MSKLWVLMKLNFLALLNSMKLGSGKKARVGGAGALIFLAVLSLYISGTYSFLFGQILSKVGLLDFLLPLIAIIGFFLAIMMTMFAAGGMIFSNRDSDFMLSLPISAFSVMLSKILALYLECLVFVALFLVPSGIAYWFYGGEVGILFVVRLLIASAFLPVLATLFSTILSYIVAWISAKTRFKSLVTTIITIVFVGGVMVLSFQLNNLSAIMLQKQEQFEALLATWLLPFGLLQKGIIGSWFDLLKFCALSLIPFLIVVWLFSMRYKKVLTGLSSHAVRNDYKMGRLQSNSQFGALFKKEARRYFGTSIYLTNTGFGALMLLGFTVYAVFARDKGQLLIMQFGGLEALLPAALLAMSAMITTINTTCVSISLEGKTLWILKEAPVSAETMFKAKAALNLIMIWPVAIIAVLVLGISYGLTPVMMLELLVPLLAMGVYFPLFGLIVNLYFPKLDCDNDTIVVKQSAASMIGIFGGWVHVAAGVGLYMLLRNTISFFVFILICTAILLIASIFMWNFLRRKGAKMLIEL